MRCLSSLTCYLPTFLKGDKIRGMKKLYDEKGLERLKKSKKILTAVTLVTAAVTLAVSITLAATARTANMGRHEFLTMIVFIAGGWLCMTLYYWGISERKKESAHMEHMLEKTPEILTGTAELTRDWVRIPNSITIREVRFDDGERIRRLHLNRRFVKNFPAGKTQMTLQVVSGYITGFQEETS